MIQFYGVYFYPLNLVDLISIDLEQTIQIVHYRINMTSTSFGLNSIFLINLKF